MILQEYPEVFQGVGKFPGVDYHIQIDPSVPPKQTPLLASTNTLKRNVPA